MLTNLLSILGLFLAQAGSAIPESKDGKTFKCPNVEGGQIKLIDRDMMRVGPGAKQLRLNAKVKACCVSGIEAPATFDFTKGNKIPFPMMGNDRYGDCYPVASAKYFIAASALTTGTAAVFDEKKLIARYLQVSRGDNGTDDDQMFSELKGGMIGPRGPHKILDFAVVSSSDVSALSLAHFAFGPTLHTFAVPRSIMQTIKPGVLWDTQSGNYVGGHAVLLTGRNDKGNFSLQTWGLNPPVEVTPRFLAANDPESIVLFSLEWFDSKGFAPNGFHYTTLAPLWTSLTGGTLPPSPFPPPPNPSPTPTPTPTPTGTIHFGVTDLTADAQARLYQSGVKSFDLTLTYGAPQLTEVPNVMPNPMVFPGPAWNPSTGGPWSNCPGGVCPAPNQGQPQPRWEPFGGLFRRK